MCHRPVGRPTTPQDGSVARASFRPASGWRQGRGRSSSRRIGGVPRGGRSVSSRRFEAPRHRTVVPPKPRQPAKPGRRPDPSIGRYPRSPCRAPAPSAAQSTLRHSSQRRTPMRGGRDPGRLRWLARDRPQTRGLNDRVSLVCGSLPPALPRSTLIEKRIIPARSFSVDFNFVAELPAGAFLGPTLGEADHQSAIRSSTQVARGNQRILQPLR